MRFLRALFVVALMGFTSVCFGQQVPEGRLMRFPDVYKDKVVFSYAGDLWLATTSGGEARRITTSPGLELFPKFSPDGKWIAFTAQYDGNFNVYVMPSEGGQPRQLTYLPDVASMPARMGPNNEVISWYPDSKSILFLSRRSTFNTWFGQLYTVSIDGGLPVRFPLPKGGLTTFSPDGTKIVYNRIFRNFRTWKRYTGGMAQDLWLYDRKVNTIQQLTHYAGTDTFPMWHGNTIYFTSDRGPHKRLNLYSLDLASKKITQLTHYTDFDVMWPSLGPDSIIFENGGYLYLFDLKSHKAKKLTFYLPGDRDQMRRRWENASKLITTFDLSPDAKRALFTARGDVFTVPAEHGSIRNLTQTPGIQERYAAWSPDGQWVAYVSDRTGENQLYIRPQKQSGKETQITTTNKVFLLPIAWSPDSTKLLYADSTLHLYYVDIHDKKPVLITQGKYFDITDYVWSPDSKWVAYANMDSNHNRAIDLYSLADRKMTPVTTSFTDSWNPAFDPGGKYLYFLSNRTYNEVLGVYDTEFANPKATGIFAVTLRADLPSPFAPRSDEAAAGKPKTAAESEAAAKKKQKAEEEALKNFRIDLEGIEGRVVGLPIPPGNYQDLQANKGNVFYVSTPTEGLSGPLPGETPAIHVFDMEKRKDSVLMAGANNYTLSFDGKKLLYSAPSAPSEGGAAALFAEGGSASTYGIVDAKPPEKPHSEGEGALNLASMKMDVDPPAEWKEIFNDAWRQERDYFYEKSMNGVDWAKVRDKYAALLPYVANRFDLNYVMGEMVGELANSHTYVGGGDFPNLQPVNVGLLGVDFGVDTANGLYRFKKIYPGQNWNPAVRSPLTEPGVKVKEGDYLLAVNGKPLRLPENPYKAFVNTAGQDVTLTVNSKPSADGAWDVQIKPISSEFRLRELNWIETNREKVDKATGGKVGYVYLPDMEDVGLNEFVRQYFPQIRKQGIIFDVRYNGGGFVDQIILEHLRRILAAMESARNFAGDTIPGNVFHGYMVDLSNRYSASDGDFFTYFFKKYKLGPVIGERTWGGVRGIRGYIPEVDGGYFTRPEFSLYNLQSHWTVENHGVAPDIELDNRPDLVVKGQDPQLERAIQYLMKEIQENPKKLPPRPPDLPAYPPGPAQ
ncbi:MAG: PDZ domain-containing protein [Terriglobia bacterium]